MSVSSRSNTNVYFEEFSFFWGKKGAFTLGNDARFNYAALV
jgi:hypothetical protein